MNEQSDKHADRVDLDLSNTSQLLPAEERQNEGRLTNEETTDAKCKNCDNKAVGRMGKIMAGVSPTTMCPSMTKLHFFATRVEIYAMLGALLYVLISFSWAETVRDPILQLAGLFVLAQIFGILVEFVHLPPLLGMLMAGIFLRYMNYFHAEGTFLKLTSTIRACAMTMILLRAGLGLDPSALCRLSTVVLRLAIIPCTLEAIAIAVASHYFLNFPWLWGFLLGCVLGAVSPAVVVPSLLWLKSEGYGENKGISTLVTAGTLLDNIFAITVFGIFLSVIFSQGSIAATVMQGPLEVLIGITWGVLMGVISIYIPHSEDKSVILSRTIMVGASGLLAVLGSQLVGYPGAGPLGCIVGAFVAGCGWRAFSPVSTYEPVLLYLSESWLFLQPFLFGLIGTEINLSAISGANTGLGVAVMITGVLVRLIACCVSVMGCGLTFKETLFVSLSWLPKATVQAAIGPVALDLARSDQLDVDGRIQLAEQVLTVAVLSILLTAPLGAIGILGAGPRLLNKSTTNHILEGELEVAERNNDMI
ncbi:sodium/hydrogen exchanger 9B1-like [Thrips palmi]|uniref:Sodium/hydrogen exchanger 9B1-like n=1 Tax=Thrips palmi TaxID=161013 RepID=A0A6P9A122_THRPL|nr:sodium/hydrogen exchanger 9B1-like [Thrips palmi]XP_034251423.1 sodium/hydrogen exchanger 9B1-like [Thrips palmi]